MAGTDDMSLVPLWLEAYTKKLAETGNEDAAVRYADTLVSRIAPSGRKYDMPSIIKGGEVEKLVAKFYTFWNTEYQNWLRVAGKTIKNPVGNAPMLMGFVASRAMFIVSSALLTGSLPGDDEDEKKKRAWWAKQFLAYPLSFFPGARELGVLALDRALGIKNYGYRPAPVVSAMQTFHKAFDTGAGWVEGTKTGQQAIEAASKAAAVGIPFLTPAYPDQFNVWFWNVYDYAMNGVDPKPGDVLRRSRARGR